MHNFHSQGKHTLPSCLSWHYRQIHTQHIIHILPGTHLYTRVESSNVDKVSCWRTKVPGIDGHRTRNSLIQSQGFNPIYHGHLHIDIEKENSVMVLAHITCIIIMLFISGITSVESQKGVHVPLRISYGCKAPFWFSTEHCWTALMPFCLSADDIYFQYFFTHIMI